MKRRSRTQRRRERRAIRWIVRSEGLPEPWARGQLSARREAARRFAGAEEDAILVALERGP